MAHLTYDWVGMERSLDAYGNAALPGLLTAEQCDAFAARELMPAIADIVVMSSFRRMLTPGGFTAG